MKKLRFRHENARDFIVHSRIYLSPKVWEIKYTIISYAVSRNYIYTTRGSSWRLGGEKIERIARKREEVRTYATTNTRKRALKAA